MDEDAVPSWAGMGGTVTGASHVRAHPDMPVDGLNQDAMAHSSGASYVIAAVSDGHGSDRYFRSASGSRFAVRAALEVLKAFVSDASPIWESETQGKDVPLQIKAIRSAADRIPREIVDSWRRQVEQDAEVNAWTDEEREVAEAKLGVGALDAYEERPYVAYGATILAAAVTDRFILYLQLGDGDIVRVLHEGESNGPPFAEDERLIANETTSLCTSKPWADFRVALEELSQQRPCPAMILLSTDGCGNSFRTSKDFHAFSRGVLGVLYDEGPRAVQDQMPGWLQAITDEGAGDDVTVMLVHQVPLPERIPLSGPLEEVSAPLESAREAPPASNPSEDAARAGASAGDAARGVATEAPAPDRDETRLTFVYPPESLDPLVATERSSTPRTSEPPVAGADPRDPGPTRETDGSPERPLGEHFTGRPKRGKNRDDTNDA